MESRLWALGNRDKLTTAIIYTTSVAKAEKDFSNFTL